MADGTRQLILDLLARNKMRKDTNEAADDLDKLGHAAEDADKKTKGLGESSEKTSKQTDKLGHSLDATKGRISSLDGEIEGIKKEIGGLSASFADAGTAAERLDFSKAIRKSQTELRNVTKNRDILKDLLPDPGPEVKSWSQKFTSSFSKDALGDLASSSFMGTAGSVIGVALAPTLGSLVSAAIVGGVGVGGIIGGIALAAKASPEIQAYATNIGHDFVSRLQAEAKDAFQGPIMDSLGKFESFANRSVGNIGKVFKAVAPSVIPLTNNLVRAGDALEGSFVNAAQKSGPVMASLGRIFEDTGDSLGNLINVAADHSDDAASALDDLDNALQNVIKVSTDVVGALGTIKGGLDSLDDKIDKARYSLEDHVSWLDLTADGYKKGSAAAELYRQGVIGVAGSANDYNHYLAGAVSSTDALKNSHQTAADAAEAQKKAEQDLTNELKAQTDPAFAVLNAIDGVRDAQKSATDSTKKYGSSSEQARDATRKLAEAAITLQGAAGAAGGSLDGTMTPSLRATLKAAGLTKSQIANVASELKRARDAAKAYEGTYKATVETYYLSITGSEKLDSSGHRVGGYRAAGGPIVRGTPYIVGENGPEVVVPDSSGRVLSNAASRGMMVSAATKGLLGAAGSGGGSGVSAVRLESAGGADQGVATLINYLIRTGKINATVAA